MKPSSHVNKKAQHITFISIDAIPPSQLSLSLSLSLFSNIDFQWELFRPTGEDQGTKDLESNRNSIKSELNKISRHHNKKKQQQKQHKRNNNNINEKRKNRNTNKPTNKHTSINSQDNQSIESKIKSNK